jgi:hypothetical protein
MKMANKNPVKINVIVAECTGYFPIQKVKDTVFIGVLAKVVI